MTPIRQVYAHELLTELVGDAPPMNDVSCAYCDLYLIVTDKPEAYKDPAEHLSTCRWARAARYLKGEPLDGGITP